MDLSNIPPPKPANKAVVGGALQSVSPSQIKTFLSCNRAWWFDKVAGLRPEVEPAHFARGTALHKQMEDYYLEGKIPEDLSCQDALLLAPKKDRTILIEHPNDYNMSLTASGIPMRGRIDLLAPPVSDGIITVTDWKSCSTFQYIKTPEELSTDVQGVTYLKYAFQEFPDARYGKFQHIYIRTSRRGAKLVETELLDKSRVDALYTNLEKVVSEIKNAASKKEQDEVGFNPKHCNAYGGCPFRGSCNAVKVDNKKLSGLTASKKTDTKMDANFLNKIKIKSKETASAPILPPDAPNVEPVTQHVVTDEDKARVEAEIKKAGEAAQDFKMNKRPEIKSTELRLFIDCIPYKADGPVTRLEEVISLITPDIVSAIREIAPKDVPEICPDLRLIGWGKGKDYLIGHFLQSPPTGIVLASSAGLSGIVAEALTAKASLVVKGV